MSNNPLNILLWRNWEPLYDYPATFSALNKYSLGGTCSQLLWHARHFVQMGHGVQVLGVAKSDVVEEQVEFIGSTEQSDQERLVTSGRVRFPDVIFLEGAFAAVEWFKLVFPKAKIVHIGQNIDRFGANKAFSQERFIDLYAFVGAGQLANYCVQYPRLRHKFILIRNIVPWNWLYKQATPNPVEDHIAWVGAWGKKGLRQWAETMQRVLLEYPSYRWTLCGPCHGARMRMEIPLHILKDLKFAKDKIAIVSAPLIPLTHILSSARIVLVSLGNECGPISILDAHAMGRPVLSGNDVVYKYCNPEGTGIRVTTAKERYEALVRLIIDPELCDRLGAIGKEFVLSDYIEQNQRNDLSQALGYLRVKDDLDFAKEYRPPSEAFEWARNVSDKAKRKIRSLGID